jgi:hypothetical protein
VTINELFWVSPEALGRRLVVFEQWVRADEIRPGLLHEARDEEEAVSFYVKLVLRERHSNSSSY